MTPASSLFPHKSTFSAILVIYTADGQLCEISLKLHFLPQLLEIGSKVGHMFKIFLLYRFFSHLSTFTVAAIVPFGSFVSLKALNSL